MPQLRTRYGTKLEPIAVRYYEGGKKIASLFCLTDQGREEELMVQDLVGDVEGAVKEMGEG